MLGNSQFDEKKALHQGDHALPVIRSAGGHDQAEIPQDLGGLPLAQEHVNPPGLEDRLLRLQSGHWIEQLHIDGCRMFDEFQVRHPALIGGTVNQFIAPVVELHGQRLDLAPEIHSHRQGQRGALDAGIVPEEPGALHRHGHDAQPVHGNRRPLLRARSPPLVMPGLHRLRPQRQRLDRAGFSAIVRTDQHRRMIEHNPLLIAEPLEVLDFDVVK